MLQRMDREAARLALSLAEGAASNDSRADGLAVDAFDSVEDAAQAHAYLTGFLLQVLANERQETVQASAEHVKGLLNRS